MSALLQRWSALLHFDPALVAAVYAGPVPGLPEESRRLLTGPDRRAWGVDTQLRGRALQGLVEEYPASAALAGITTLGAFFSSEAFHRAVLDRGSVSDAFGAWIGPKAGAIGTLERAMARCRRQPTVTVPAGAIGAAEVVVVHLPEGTLPAMEALRRAVGANPVGTLASPKWRLPPLPPLGPLPEPLLVERAEGDELRVGSIPEALAALIEALATPLPVADARAAAVALGAETEAEAAEILEDLRRDGVLRAG